MEDTRLESYTIVVGLAFLSVTASVLLLANALDERVVAIYADQISCISCWTCVGFAFLSVVASVFDTRQRLR